MLSPLKANKYPEHSIKLSFSKLSFLNLFAASNKKFAQYPYFVFLFSIGVGLPVTHPISGSKNKFVISYCQIISNLMSNSFFPPQRPKVIIFYNYILCALRFYSDLQCVEKRIANVKIFFHSLFYPSQEYSQIIR